MISDPREAGFSAKVRLSHPWGQAVPGGIGWGDHRETALGYMCHVRDSSSRCDTRAQIALRRWLPSPGHVFCHGGLPDIDAKLEQFAVDPRCSPKRVRDAHVPNELPNVRRHLWPATVRS
jgi:hypothetical protein